MTDSLLERIQKEPAVIVEFAQALILEKNRVKALECELNTAKPKADYYDAFINPDDCTNIRTTAKELKIPERKFVQFLLREKYLFRSPSGQLLPYNKDSSAGLFIVRDFVTCSTSRKKGKEVCDTHFIRAVVLEEGALQHMRLVIQCVADYEDAFRRALGAKRSEEAKKELSAKKRTLQKSENRLAELDRLFKRIYEDMVNGKLSEARFQMLADDYEQEQADLRAKIEMLENEIQNQEDQAENVDRFIRQAKKYLYLEKLTPTILNDMVNAVYVHAPDKSSGHRVQDVTISYNYIGILPANLLYDVMNGKAA